MPTLKYWTHNFPSSAPTSLLHRGRLTLTWKDLVWAAITVGKPGGSYLFTHGWHSLSDIISRTHAIYANLRTSKGGLVKSSLYDASDPTEKGATSYFIGMLIAKLACDRLLGTPFLFHFSMTGPMGIPVRMRGTLEPDLVGLLRNGNWIVVEAKGRTHGKDAHALIKAKKQTQAIRSISGSKPVYRIASQTYFNPDMRLILDDPVPEDRDLIDVEIDMAATYRRYYSAAFEATKNSSDVRSVGAHKYAFASVPGTGLEIGLSTNLRALFESDRTQSLLPHATKTAYPVSDYESTRTYGDGIAITTDGRWAESNMMLEPLDRSLIVS